VWHSLTLLAANEFGALFRRNVYAAIFYGLSGIVTLAGLIFGLVAAHFWLRIRMTDIEASLVIAGALLVLATIMAFLGYFLKHRRRSQSELTVTAIAALPLAARLVTARANWGTIAVAGVLALGVLLGRQLTEKKDA
jgi:hypothetical protein